MIPKGTHKPLNATPAANESKVCIDLCFIPTQLSGVIALSPSSTIDDKRENIQEHQSRKRQRQSHHHSANKLERLLFDEIRQCDGCGRRVLHLLKEYEEDEPVANALPKFLEGHNICSALQCTWCSESESSKKNRNKYPSCDALYCSEKCRSRAESALSNSSTAETLLIPPPKLFFCRNRYTTLNDADGNDVDELVEDVIQSLTALESKFRVLCGNNFLGVDECAMLVNTILSIIAPCWLDNFMESIVDNMNSSSFDEESLAEEFWVLARSHWSMMKLLQQSNQQNAASKQQQFMSYEMFCKIYLHIKRHCLCRVVVPSHPLVSYAMNTLISADALTEDERDVALGILEHPCLPISSRHARSKTNDKDQRSIFRWRNAAHTAHWLSNPASLEGKGADRIQSHLSQTYFVFSPWIFREMQHSCCPITMSDIQDPDSPLDSLSWLALHDAEEEDLLNSFSLLSSLEDDLSTRAVELKKLYGSDFTCTCIRCQYEKDTGANKSADDFLDCFNQKQLKRLADLAMQHGRFTDAFELYDLILRAHPRDGTVLHARAAASLAIASSSFVDRGHCGGYYIRAQRLWDDAGVVCCDHSDIALHVEKQRVYGTLASLNGSDKDDSSILDNIQCSTYLNGKCFIGTPLLSEAECRLIIHITEEHCNSTSGWSTSRHYAVPTTDIPIHEITKLHPLFTKLWSDRIRPLMRRQFKLESKRHQRRDIFIHDAFVVRYDSSKQRYLPPHIDESSHSFIIALNTEFKGGGTYIHELESVLRPTIGGMVSFEGGSLLHSGDPVIDGVRYCVVAFCYIDQVQVAAESAETIKVKNDDTAATAPFSFGFQFG